MTQQFLPLMTMLMAFGAVAAVVFVTGQYVTTQARVQKRVGALQGEPETTELLAGVSTLVSSYFDEKRFGLEDSFKAKLRRDLLRAGFFNVQNVSHYIFIRIAGATVLPGLACVFAFVGLQNYGWSVKLALVAGAFVVGEFGAPALFFRRPRPVVGPVLALFSV